MSELPGIRRLTPDDAAAMLAYLREFAAEDHDTVYRRASFPDLEQERGWLQARTGEDGAIFGAELPGGRIVGIAECQRARQPQARHNAELGVSVLRAFHRRGLGRELMRSLIGWCAATPGVDFLRLEVTAHNAGAIALYRQLDFAIDGVRREYVQLDDRRMDLVQMSKRIRPVG